MSFWSPGGLAAVVLAHLGILAALMSVRSAPLPAPLETLMVRMIHEVPAEPPKPPPPVPRPPAPKPPVVKPPAPRPPVPIAQPPEPPAPVLTAETSAPATRHEVAPLPPPPPPARPAPPAPLTIPAPEPAPVAVVAPPRFDADYLDNPSPVYPTLSRRLREEGKVVLRVRVEPDGQPSQVEVKLSSGASRLDQSARNAVARWKFAPARRGDTAVAAWVLVPIVFNLKE